MASGATLTTFDARDAGERGAVVVSLGQQIAARHDADAMTTVVDERIGTVLTELEPAPRFPHAGCGTDRFHLACHHITDARRTQDVGPVVARHMQTSACEFLGHEAMVQQRGGDEISDDRRDHQRKDRVVVTGELEGEHDRGERRSGRGPEGCGHRHQRDGTHRQVQTGRDLVRQLAEQRAEASRDEQYRR